MLRSTRDASSFGVLPAGSEHFFGADLREPHTSELEMAATILQRATCYLISEQMSERCTSIQANRDAIRLLCHAGRQISFEERRAPARRTLRVWIKNVLFEPNRLDIVRVSPGRTAADRPSP